MSSLLDKAVRLGIIKAGKGGSQMMDSSCIILLKNMYETLSPAEKAAADFLLAHAEAVAMMTVAELADASGAAPSTIVRLSKRLGFTGYTQLRLNLFRYETDAADSLIPAVDKDDDNGDVFKKVFHSGIVALQDTLKMLDADAVDNIVSHLFDAKRILFFGIGTSYPIAIDAYFRFMRIGFPASEAHDGMIMRVAASQLEAGDVAVGISHSGKTRDTFDTLEIAKAAGAFTVAISSTRNSPLVASADEALVVYSDEIRYSMEAVSARIAHIAILDALCVALSLKDPERTRANMQSVYAQLRSLRK